MLEQKSNTEGITLPGRNPELGAVERYVKIGWALVGIAFTSIIFGFVLKQAGFSLLPAQPSRIDIARLFAFSIACLNIATWMWFPLEDLQVLRCWVHTKRKILPANTSEFYAIMLAMILLLVLIFAALSSAVWFGIAGTAVYLWNLIGYSYVRKHVNQAVEEASSIFGQEAEPQRGFLLEALEVIKLHWSLGYSNLFGGRQQLRHGLVALAFGAVTLLAIVGRSYKLERFTFLSYIAGGVTLIAAEGWIGYWRAGRDRKLTVLHEALRDYYEK